MPAVCRAIHGRDAVQWLIRRHSPRVRRDMSPIETAQDVDLEEQDDAIVGVALKWSLLAFGLIAVCVIPIIILFNRSSPAEITRESELAVVELRNTEDATAPQVIFREVTSSAGIEFVHENGARGQKLLPETMGGGVAFFDFDNDGDQDLLFVNSQTWAEYAREPVDTPATLALYENNGEGSFQDVTSGSGLDISLYGMGAGCGDYDGDGLVDVYVTAVGTNRLFRNLGAGRFEDVTDRLHVGGDSDRWSTSCGWFDYDRDGDLDLFVCNYVDWSPEFDLAQDFKLTGGDRAYGRPQNFEGVFPYLFRNDGSDGFADVTEAAGLHVRNPATNVPMAKSLGVTFDDFDQDGWLDMVVANDTVQNFLFRNKQDGTFEEVGLLSGIAFDQNGVARGAMGIDTAHFRNDPTLGVAIGNFSNEMTALYVARANDLQFVDEALSTGLGPATRLSLTFGVFFFDYDLDGQLDLFASNGHLEQDINRVQPSQFYEQPPQLFWNCGAQLDTEFLHVDDDAVGTDFLKPLVGRGSSFADIDGDGDLDIVIATTGQQPRLLRNDLDLNHHWIRFQLTSPGNNRYAIGALIEVESNGRVLRRRVSPTKSYLSQVELPVTFGLGTSNSIDRVTIVWPDGQIQEVTEFSVNQSNTIHQQVAEQAVSTN